MSNIHAQGNPEQGPVSGRWTCVHQPPAYVNTWPDSGVILVHLLTSGRPHDEDAVETAVAITLNGQVVPERGEPLSETEVLSFVTQAIIKAQELAPVPRPAAA